MWENVPLEQDTLEIFLSFPFFAYFDETSITWVPYGHYINTLDAKTKNIMVHFQVIGGLELRALCLCISGNILLQDFYQNHFKLSVFLSNNLECSTHHHRLCQPLQTSFESADEKLN